MQFLQIQFHVEKIGVVDEESFGEIFTRLKSLKGVEMMILRHNTLAIYSNVPSSILQKKIESAGYVAKLKQYGG